MGLFRKDTLEPNEANWSSLAAAVIAVAAYLTVLLTSYGLPLGYMGDILGRRVPAVPWPAS